MKSIMNVVNATAIKMMIATPDNSVFIATGDQESLFSQDIVSWDPSPGHNKRSASDQIQRPVIGTQNVNKEAAT